MTAVDGRAGQGGAGRGRSAHAPIYGAGLSRPLPAGIKRLRESAGFQNSKGLRSAGQEARRRLRGAGGREGPTPGRAVSADPRGSGTGLGSLWAKVNVGRTET